MNANKNVNNLSSKVLNKAKISVLSKGLTIYMAPKSVNALDFVTGIESAFAHLSEKQDDRFRCEASLLLRNIPPTKSNATREEKRAMLILEKDDTVKISHANKGNATVDSSKTSDFASESREGAVSYPVSYSITSYQYLSSLFCLIPTRVIGYGPDSTHSQNRV
ncbi:hypothetical protein J6590_020949 [Homalodisca vitripennis]|nr:hypothetical protein J6590_020949 [Homalodisca vitripennis]